MAYPVYLMTEARSSLAYCKNGFSIPKSFRKIYTPALTTKYLRVLYFMKMEPVYS